MYEPIEHEVLCGRMAYIVKRHRFVDDFGRSVFNLEWRQREPDKPPENQPDLLGGEA